MLAMNTSIKARTRPTIPIELKLLIYFFTVDLQRVSKGGRDTIGVAPGSQRYPKYAVSSSLRSSNSLDQESARRAIPPVDPVLCNFSFDSPCHLGALKDKQNHQQFSCGYGAIRTSSTVNCAFLNTRLARRRVMTLFLSTVGCPRSSYRRILRVEMLSALCEIRKSFKCEVSRAGSSMIRSLIPAARARSLPQCGHILTKPNSEISACVPFPNNRATYSWSFRHDSA
jgi:hypothetical protein